MAGSDVAALSRGEFGAVAVPRILELLEKHGILSTFFVPGHTALAYPELIRRIRDEGHEIGHHGWVHESVLALGVDREREVFERGLEALDRAAGVRPVGYRAPSAEVSASTVDVLLAFPQLVFGLLVVSILGAKVWLIIVAVAVGHAPQVARVIRSAALDVCERDFVKSAELIDTPAWRVMVGEVIPNLMSPITVEAGLRLTYSVIIIAGLSFLGFGLQPPTPSWGVMVNENRIGLTSNPWAVLGPVILLAVLTIGTNTFADAVARVSLGVERPRPRGGLFSRRRTNRESEA